MNPKIAPSIDLSKEETSWFRIRLSQSFSQDEIAMLKDLGAVLFYDNGIMALITIYPNKLEEVAKIESVIQIS